MGFDQECYTLLYFYCISMDHDSFRRKMTKMKRSGSKFLATLHV